MNLSYYIYKKINKSDKQTLLAKVIAKFSVATITLGICVMIISMAISNGYKKEITNLVTGFVSHIKVTGFEKNKNIESDPINSNIPYLIEIKNNPEIKHIQKYATKAGIIRADTNIQGAILKGIDKDYNLEFLKSKLIDGSVTILDSIRPSNEIIISETISKKLNLKIGDNLDMYFIQDPPRARRFKIKGIYSSGMPDFDNIFIYSDIKQIQKLNNWDSLTITGYEILLNNFSKIEQTTQEIYENLPPDIYVSNIKENYPHIFSWLDILNVNVEVILILMITVALINMISTILIIIFERIHMIGILKSLGMTSKSIKNIFLFHAKNIITKGLIYGNISGLTISLLQYFTHLIKLDPEKYYINYVPININVIDILLLTTGTFVICMIFLFIPITIINKINPITILRYK